ASQTAHEPGQVAGTAADGEVYGGEAEHAEGRVVHGGRQRVVDRIAQQRKDAGTRARHHRPAAIRVMAPSISSSSWRNVTRYASRSAPNGSATSPSCWPGPA